LRERNKEVIRLAKTGMSYESVSKIIENKHGEVIGRSRISQIVREHIREEGEGI